MNVIPLYLVFGINILTSIVKRWIYPKFGVVGTQVFGFVLAFIGALYWTYKAKIPGLENLITSAVALFALAVAFYEVILQHVPIFKGPSLEEQP